MTVGTEHYPFDRLVGWVDGWLASERGAGVRCVMQCGVSAHSRLGGSRSFFAYEEMQSLMEQADVVVCHGGTGSVMLSRAVGVKPIVVPRRRRFGEHVDDHQVVFARRLASTGRIELADTEDRLRSLLDAFVDGQLDLRVDRAGDDAQAAARRFGELVDGLLAGRVRRSR